MLGNSYNTRESYIESTRLNDVTGEVSVSSTTTTNTTFKSDKEMFSDVLGISRYFVIFCLIMFFIAPVFAELNSDYKWEVTENGNTYTYVNPKDNVDNYKDLGNKMLGGFTETLETIGNISETAGNLVETVGTPLGWFNDVYNVAMSGYNKVLEWFNGLFS